MEINDHNIWIWLILSITIRYLILLKCKFLSRYSIIPHSLWQNIIFLWMTGLECSLEYLRWLAVPLVLLGRWSKWTWWTLITLPWMCLGCQCFFQHIQTLIVASLGLSLCYFQSLNSLIILINFIHINLILSWSISIMIWLFLLMIMMSIWFIFDLLCTWINRFLLFINFTCIFI